MDVAKTREKTAFGSGADGRVTSGVRVSSKPPPQQAPGVAFDPLPPPSTAGSAYPHQAPLNGPRSNTPYPAPPPPSAALSEAPRNEPGPATDDTRPLHEGNAGTTLKPRTLNRKAGKTALHSSHDHSSLTAAIKKTSAHTLNKAKSKKSVVGGATLKRNAAALAKEAKRRKAKGKPELTAEMEKGTECSGRALCRRYTKENGVQLGRAEGVRLESGFVERVLSAPPASYICVKLLAEFYEAALSVSGAEAGPALTILGCLNADWVPDSKRAALEAGKVDGALAQTPAAAARLKAALGGQKEAAPLGKAMAAKSLLSLEQLAGLMLGLGRGLESTDEALNRELEALSAAGIVSSEDVDHYLRLITTLKEKENKNQLLVFGPRLAAEHAEVQLNGLVVLRRHAPAIANAVLSPPADWTSLKVIAILFDVLYHMPASAERMAGPPGIKFHLGTLGCLNRVFMNLAQKKDILVGRRANLDDANLDVLKDLSTNAKNCSVNPKKQVAVGAKRIQRNILDNSIFNLQELVELFTNLALRFYIPVDFYKAMLQHMVTLKMLLPQDEKEIAAHISSDDKRQGVHFFNVAALFTVRIELTDDGEGTMVPRSLYLPVSKHNYYGDDDADESGDEDESGTTSGDETSGGETTTSGATLTRSGATGRSKTMPTAAVEAIKVSEMDKTLPSSREVNATMLWEYVSQRVSGDAAPRHAFDARGYSRALAFLHKSGAKDADVAVAYLQSAVERKRPIPSQEAAFIIGTIGHQADMDKDNVRALVDRLLAAHFLRPHQAHNLNTNTSITALAFKTLLDKLIPPHKKEVAARADVQKLRDDLIELGEAKAKLEESAKPAKSPLKGDEDVSSSVSEAGEERPVPAGSLISIQSDPELELLAVFSAKPAKSPLDEKGPVSLAPIYSDPELELLAAFSAKPAKSPLKGDVDVSSSGSEAGEAGEKRPVSLTSIYSDPELELLAAFSAKPAKSPLDEKAAASATKVKDLTDLVPSAHACGKFEQGFKWAIELVNAKTGPMSITESNVVEVAFKDYIRQLIAQFEKLQTNATPAGKACVLGFVDDERKIVVQHSQTALTLIHDHVLVGKNLSGEVRARMLKLSADIRRHIIPYIPSTNIAAAKDSIVSEYKLARAVAKNSVHKAHPLRLGIVVNSCLFHRRALIEYGLADRWKAERLARAMLLEAMEGANTADPEYPVAYGLMITLVKFLPEEEREEMEEKIPKTVIPAASSSAGHYLPPTARKIPSTTN